MINLPARDKKIITPITARVITMAVLLVILSPPGQSLFILIRATYTFRRYRAGKSSPIG